MDTLIKEDRSVAELKRLEEELNEYAQLNSAFMNALPDLVFLIHQDGTYLDYHARSADELFVPPDEFLGRHVRDIMPPHIADQIFVMFEEARKSGTTQCFEYSLDTNGVENIYECRIIQSGADKFLSIVRNITEQRLFRKALAESEKRFEAQYRNNPVPIYVWSKTGDDFVLVDYNSAAAAAENGAAETLLGIKASEQYAEYPVIFEGFNKCYHEKKTLEIELPYFPSKLREEKFIYLTYVFIPSNMVMLHAQDLTQHKRALKELQRNVKELQDAQEEIAANSEEITQQYNELKSSRAALEAERERYRELFDSPPDGYLITDRSGTILESNRAAAAMLEIEQSRLKGFPMVSFISREDRKSFRALLAALQVRNGIREIEIVLLRNRQEEFQAAVTVSHVISDGEENFRWIIRDVTEKKRVRRELQQSEEFNRSIIDSSSDCIKILDLEGRLLYLNPKGQELLEMEDDSCLGSAWLDFWNDADKSVLKPEVEKAKQGGVGRHQGHCATARGTSKWWDVQINPVTDIDGRVERLLVISRDITEQTLAAEKLLKKERFFRSLIEDTHDIITVLRLDGIIVYESPSVEQALGYRLEERIGCNCFDGIHPDDLAAAQKAFSEAIETGRLSHPVEYRYRHKNGSWLNLEVTGQLSTDETGEQIVIVTKRDITERRIMEEKLRNSEELYRNVVETQTELICRFLPDGSLTFVNDAYCRYFGKSREELIGMKFYKLTPKGSPLLVEELVNTLIAKRESVTVESEVIRADGSIGWQRWIDNVVLDAQGNVVEFQGIGRDITEQKMIEEKLRQSEELYRNVVETQTELICRYLPDSTLTFVNEAYCRYFGKSREELIGSKYLELMPEEARAKSVEFTKLLIATGKTELIEHKVMLPDGSIGWQQWIDNVIKDAQGNIIELQGIGRDITEQKRAAESLRESEERFYSFMSNSPVAAWIDDEDGRIQYLNPAYRKSIKLPEEEVVGKSLFDVFPDESARQYHSMIKDALAGEPADKFIIDILRPDNSTGTFLSYCFPLSSSKEGKRLIGGFAIDITEQRFYEKALSESEEKYRRIVDTMLEGIWVTNNDMKIVFANRQVSELLGYELEEMLGRPVFDLYDEETQRRAPQISQRRRSGISEHYDTRLRRKDGSYIWAIISATPYYDAGGEFAGSMAMVTDITERKQAEESLREQEALLRGLIEQIPDGTINIFDRDFRYLMAEGRELDRIGLSREKLEGKRLSELFPKESVNYVLPFYKRAFAGEEVWFEFPIFEQIYYVCALPLHERDDRINKILVVTRNITEQKQKEEELQQLSARLLNLQDEERRRLARELHDETAQNLAGLGINLAAIKKIVPDNEKALMLLRESEWLTTKSLREVRTLSYLLHPPMLDEGGLVSALKWFINGFTARSGINIEFTPRGEIGRLTSDIETALYRIVQEGLTNIHRHSGSPTAHIELIREPDEIILRLKDEGRGIPENIPDETGSSFRLVGVGIAGMRERLRLLGGHLEINSDKSGTTLTATVPLEVEV